MIKTYKQRRFIILFASVFLQFCYGIAYVWSVYQPYVKQRFGMDNASANMPFAILLACFSLGNVVGGLLQKRFLPVYLVMAGNLSLLVGLLLSAFIPLEKGYLLNVTYGILGGLGAGVAYNTTVSVVQKWFPDKRGLVTGILICSTGSFGLIMNPFALKMLSTYGYETATLAVTALMGLCLIAGGGFIKNPVTQVATMETSPFVEVERHYKISEVLKTPQYYMITLSMMLAVPGYFLINPMLMSLGTQRGLTQDMALVGVMLVAVMNTSGRLFAPWVSDWLGRKAMIIFLFSINIVAILFVVFSKELQFVAAICSVGFAYGGFMGMYPTITADYFGTRYNGINYGAVMMGYGMSSLACPYLVRAVQNTQMGTMLSLLITSGTSVLGIVLMLLLKRPRDERMIETFLFKNRLGDLGGIK